jgi:protein phosphatase 1L
MEDEYNVISQLYSPTEKPVQILDKTAFFGVFDGHAGGKCSKFLSQFLPQYIANEPDFQSNLSAATYRGFLKANSDFLQRSEINNFNDGSTAICVILRNSTLLVANVGDSRGVLCCQGIAVPLSTDHKPGKPEEYRRIQARGGQVTFNFGVPRVNGALAVSRAFGDRNLHKFISAEPEISTQILTEKDEFIILATDGVWDVIRNQEAVDIVHRCLIKQNYNCKKCALILVESASRRGSQDNITAIVIDLRGLISGLKSRSESVINESYGSMSSFKQTIGIDLIRCKRRSSML